MPRLPNSHQFLWSFVSVTLRQAGHGFLRACDVVGCTNNKAHPHLQPDGLLDPSDENEELERWVLTILNYLFLREERG